MSISIIAELLKLTVLAGLAIAAILTVSIWKKDRATKVTSIKFVIQALSLVATFFLFAHQVSPFLVLSIILIIPIFLGRFFCGWICPFGLYMDILTKIRTIFKIRHRNIPVKLNKFLHNFRYTLFLFFLVVAIIRSLTAADSNLNLLIQNAFLFTGPFQHLRILLGPLVPLIVPLNGQLHLYELYFSFPYIQQINSFLSGNIVIIISLIFLALVCVGSFFVKRVWCRFCPTGSSIAVLNRFKIFDWAPTIHLNKNEIKCTKCGICKRVCPVDVNEVYTQKGGKIKTSMCIHCFRCIEMCPYEGCLKLKFGQKTVFASRNWLNSSEVD